MYECSLNLRWPCNNALITPLPWYTPSYLRMSVNVRRHYLYFRLIPVVFTIQVCQIDRLRRYILGLLIMPLH